MSYPETLYGQVKGTADVYNGNSGQPVPLQTNNRGDLLVAQSLPHYAELTRLGGGWAGRNTTGVAAVTANPAITASHYTLYNGELVSNGKSLVIARIVVDKFVTDATQTNPFKLLAEVSGAGIETAPTNASNSKSSLSGKGTYAGLARIALSQTVVGSAWFSLGTTPSHGAGGTFASDANTSMDVPIDGMIIVPPTGELNLAVVEATAAAAVQFFYTVFWYEVLLALG